MTLERDLDPIAFSIIWGRLISIIDEAAVTLSRTAFSELITESNDFGVVLLDTNGYAIAQSSFSIPPFLGTIPLAVRSILGKFPPDTWVEGDVALANDPWNSGGHLNDITAVTPIFHEGKLVGFTGSTAHWGDIGGTGFSSDSKELYEEGLIIPSCKVYRGGKVDQDLLDILMKNNRVPDKMYGDLNAQIDAGTVCQKRLSDILHELDLPELTSLAATIQDVGEEAMRRRIAEVPDGEYHHSIEVDGLGYTYTIKAKIEVNDTEMSIDYTGTSPQLPGPVNCPFVYTSALTFHALKCILDPTTPNNDGCHRPLSIYAPPGTVANPTVPAAVNGRHLVGHHMSRLVYGALKDVLPDKIIADSGSTPTVVAKFSSVGSSKKPFSTTYLGNGGMGARPDKDGLSCAPFPTNPSCGSMEILETATPLRILQKNLVPNSGGAGQFRGGLGQEIDFQVVGDEPVVLSLFFGGMVYPPQGLFNGRPGILHTFRINGEEPTEATGRLVLQPGDVVTITFGGGGGYGAPEDRDRQLVLDDLRKGFITATTATESYGLSPDDADIKRAVDGH